MIGFFIYDMRGCVPCADGARHWQTKFARVVSLHVHEQGQGQARACPCHPAYVRTGTLAGLLLFLCLPVVALAQSGDGYEIKRSKVAGGGGETAGGGFKLRGTMGEHDAGTATGGGYVLTGGFSLSPFVPEPPILAPAPHDILKNRYISIDPRGAGGINVGKDFDIRLTLSSTLVNGVTVVGSQWWANAADADCISVVGPSRPIAPPNWDACPTLHLTGCPIIPTSTYDIVVVEGSNVSDSPLVAATQAKPGVKWHGDCVGFFTGTEWTAPNFTTNIDDAVAAIKTFQNPSNTPGCATPPCNATHTSVTDMEPNLTPGPQINSVVNIADVFSIFLGFQGFEYPGPDLTQCQ